MKNVFLLLFFGAFTFSFQAQDGSLDYRNGGVSFTLEFDSAFLALVDVELLVNRSSALHHLERNTSSDPTLFGRIWSGEAGHSDLYEWKLHNNTLEVMHNALTEVIYSDSNEVSIYYSYAASCSVMQTVFSPAPARRNKLYAKLEQLYKQW